MDIGTKVAMAASAAMIVFGCSALVAWQVARREQAELRQKLDAAEQQVREANARQESRKADLDKAVAQLASQKKKVQTPKQAIEALPSVLPLPIEISPPLSPNRVRSKDSVAETAHDDLDTSQPAALPAQDLKPLYDFAVDCKACQLELNAARERSERRASQDGGAQQGTG